MKRLHIGKPERHKGYEFAQGALDALLDTFLFYLVVALVIHAIYAWQGWGTDATDADGWNRSGLKLHTDHGTGVEYLSDGKGSLTPRIKP